MSAAEKRTVYPQHTGMVPFHDQQVRGALAEGEAWVRVSDVCERLGIDVARQAARLQNDPSFQTYVCLIADGKGRPSWYLRGDKVPGWVRTINANKVKPEAKAALLWVQEQFDRVLHAWVTGADIPASPIRPDARPDGVISIGNRFAQNIDDLVVFIADAVTARVMGEVRGLIGNTPAHAQIAAEQATEANRRLKDTIKGGWMPDGCWYIAVNEQDGMMSLGETSKDHADRRLEDGDYNGNKAGYKPWSIAHCLRVDKRKKAQAWLQQMARQYGCTHLGGDKFSLDWVFIADARKIAEPMTVEDLKKTVEDRGLFEPLIFRRPE